MYPSSLQLLICPIPSHAGALELCQKRVWIDIRYTRAEPCGNRRRSPLSPSPTNLRCGVSLTGSTSEQTAGGVGVTSSHESIEADDTPPQIILVRTRDQALRGSLQRASRDNAARPQGGLLPLHLTAKLQLMSSRSINWLHRNWASWLSGALLEA